MVPALRSLRHSALKALEAPIASAFHLLYHHMQGRTWLNTYFFGTAIQKVPFDLWVMQEILFETKPDFIIETGTFHGGSAMYFAMLCDFAGHGEIVSIDIDDNKPPPHPRVHYIVGSSVDPRVAEKVSQLAAGKKSVMVVLDSDHHKPHVSAEIETYSGMVTPGNYMIVEDTNFNGHPVFPMFGPGPMEAVKEFLAKNNDFVQDRSREKFYFTFNPGGYLKKVR